MRVEEKATIELHFHRANGEFVQRVTSLNMTSYIHGVMTALGNVGYNILQDMDTGKWEAWKDGEIGLVFFEVARKENL